MSSYMNPSFSSSSRTKRSFGVNLKTERGLELAPDDKDPYVNTMNALSRKGTHVPEEYLLDRLLLAGIVEARGCERFGMVA
ncbi:MAG: hypothetical protein IH802_04660, partial [Nitrospinae bacterium]|nr:hypothetical protein [Nitrospinota bacterium]